MNSVEQADLEQGWRELPLCGRYLAVLFGRDQVVVREEGIARAVHLRWAVGVLEHAQFEVMGAWALCAPEAEDWKQVFDDLVARGVESIRFVFDCESQTIKQLVRWTCPGAVVIAAASQTRHHSQSRACPSVKTAPGAAMLRTGGGVGHGLEIGTMTARPDDMSSARERRLVRAGLEHMTRIHRSVRRTMGRSGDFGSVQAGLFFFLTVLRRAERRVGSADGWMESTADYLRGLPARQARTAGIEPLAVDNRHPVV